VDGLLGFGAIVNVKAQPGISGRDRLCFFSHSCFATEIHAHHTLLMVRATAGHEIRHSATVVQQHKTIKKKQTENTLFEQKIQSEHV